MDAAIAIHYMDQRLREGEPRDHRTFGPTATTRPPAAMYDLNWTDHMPKGL